MITKRFEKVLAKVGHLPEAEQDALADWILEELEDEKRWQKSFTESQDKLEQMAENALKEHKQGRTTPLDPNKL